MLLLLGGLTKRNTPVLKVRGARSAERRKALKVGTKVVRSAARSPPEATARLRPTELQGHGTNLLNRGLVVLCPGRLSPTDRDSRERFRGSGIGVELLIEMAERGERHDGKVPPNRLSRSCSIMTLGYLTPFCPSLVPSRRPGLNALVAALPVATFVATFGDICATSRSIVSASTLAADSCPRSATIFGRLLGWTLASDQWTKSSGTQGRDFAGAELGWSSFAHQRPGGRSQRRVEQGHDAGAAARARFTILATVAGVSPAALPGVSGGSAEFSPSSPRRAAPEPRSCALRPGAPRNSGPSGMTNGWPP